MSSVLKTVKWFFWKNAHAKTESNSKTEHDQLVLFYIYVHSTDF